jgi:hypothetical protein
MSPHLPGNRAQKSSAKAPAKAAAKAKGKATMEATGTAKRVRVMSKSPQGQSSLCSLVDHYRAVGLTLPGKGDPPIDQLHLMKQNMESLWTLHSFANVAAQDICNKTVEHVKAIQKRLEDTEAELADLKASTEAELAHAEKVSTEANLAHVTAELAATKDKLMQAEEKATGYMEGLAATVDKLDRAEQKVDMYMEELGSSKSENALLKLEIQDLHRNLEASSAEKKQTMAVFAEVLDRYRIDCDNSRSSCEAIMKSDAMRQACAIDPKLRRFRLPTMPSNSEPPSLPIPALSFSTDSARTRLQAHVNYVSGI